MALDRYFLIKEIYLINIIFLQVRKILLSQNEVRNELQCWLVFLKRILKKLWDTVKTDIFVGNFLIIFRTSQSEMEINCDAIAHLLIKGKAVGKGIGMMSENVYKITGNFTKCS